jgi:hypothetical protein
VFFVLATGDPAGRKEEDVRRMEREYGWPVEHREGGTDLVLHEKCFHDGLVSFNKSSTNIKAVLVNQFGWTREALGERCPEGMSYATLRRGTDVEFGQAIYEPFGISALEPLSAGAIVVLSNTCGAVGLIEKVNGLSTDNLIVANFTDLALENTTIEYLKNLSRETRESMETREAARVSACLLSRLPRTDGQVQALVESGRALARKMSWDEIAGKYFLPALGLG